MRQRNKEITNSVDYKHYGDEEFNSYVEYKNKQNIYNYSRWSIFVLIIVTLLLFLTVYFKEETRKLDNAVHYEKFEVNDNFLTHVSAIQRTLFNHKSFIEGTRHDSLYSTVLYNKAFMALADIQSTTVTDANAQEHVYNPNSPKSIADKVLYDNMLYIQVYQEISAKLIEIFIEEMMKKEKEKVPLIIYIKIDQIAEFVLKCLKEQSHVLLPPNVELSERRKFVLIADNSDASASHSFFTNKMETKVHIEHDLLDHPLLQHWFGHNADIMHRKFTVIPIGIDFHTIAKRSSRYCHQTPPEQTLQMIEPMLNVINVKSMLPSYVNLQSVNLHPRFAPGESEEERFDFSQVDWALLPQQKRKADNSSSSNNDEQRLKWTSFDELDEMERKLLSTKEVEFGIIIEGASRDHNKQEQYITKKCDKNVNMSTDLSQSTFHRIALMTHHHDDDNDKQHNNNKKINSLTLYAPLSEVYLHALRQSGFGNPTLRETKVLLTFTGQNYPPLRNPIVNYLEKHVNDFAIDGRVKRNKVWSIMRRYAFIASPPGYGYDCHRTWEALTLGCIPIVVHPSQYNHGDRKNTFRHHRNGVSSIDVNASLQLYDDLPVVVVNNFETEVNLNSLRKWQTEIHEKNVNGEYNLRKLLNQYWFDRFLGKE